MCKAVTVRTEVAAADAVDKRVAAAGGEDERLSDGVEDTEHYHIVTCRQGTRGRVHPLLVSTHEADDVTGSPTDDERRRDGQHGRRDVLYLTARPLWRRRRLNRRALMGRRRPGGRRVRRVDHRARRVLHSTQQTPVADAHDDDRPREADDELEHVPEELMDQLWVGRPADLTAVADGVDVRV